MNNAVPRRWLFIADEAAVPDDADGDGRWALDLLYLDQDATPTLVEVKRKGDSRLRREVVGQMLDYAANAVAYWPGESLRELFAATCGERKLDPSAVLTEFLGDEDAETFWEMARSNLREGRVRLVFVADRIPSELQRIVEFLNERMNPTEVLALELRRYAGEGLSTHVPRVIGQTSDAQLIKGASTRKTAGTRRAWSEQTFREDVVRSIPEEFRPAIEELLAFTKAEAKLDNWGTGSKRGSISPKFPEIRRPGQNARKADNPNGLIVAGRARTASIVDLLSALKPVCPQGSSRAS
jgi:hypothetical protein